jgi:ribonuclease M5
MKPKIREVIVVEGKSDTNKIQAAVEAETIETQGLALEPETIELIKQAHETRGVIVFTDPDYPGETIRKKIAQIIPEVKHAFITTNEGEPKFKGTLGIEHASIETIRVALKGLYSISENDQPTVSKKFLRNSGLTGAKNSKQLRIKLGEKLRIGYTNSKQLQKRLTMFGISEGEVTQTIKEIKEEGFNE